MQFSRLRSLPVFVLALAVVPLKTSAQVNFASVSGQVIDAAKGEVSGVNVLLKSTATGLARSTRTDAHGLYEFTAVKPDE